LTEKTDTFFIISNYKTDPRYLLEYCQDYLICDQSESPELRQTLSSYRFVETPHTGHNITDYFSFFADHYDNLPEFMALIKGNIIGRHLSREFFERVYRNKFFTFLYEDRDIREKVNREVFFLSQENQFLEINNSWYVPHHPHRFFSSFNDLLRFVYRDPLIPEYCCFAPGACYIVSKHQVRKNSRPFYRNLNKIMSYTLVPRFPSEAHQVERMLNIIFSSNYLVNDHMNDEFLFDAALEKQVEQERQQAKEEAGRSSPGALQGGLGRRVLKSVARRVRNLFRW
jgi:hypothetical protein